MKIQAHGCEKQSVQSRKVLCRIMTGDVDAKDQPAAAPQRDGRRRRAHGQRAQRPQRREEDADEPRLEQLRLPPEREPPLPDFYEAHVQQPHRGQDEGVAAAAHEHERRQRGAGEPEPGQHAVHRHDLGRHEPKYGRVLLVQRPRLRPRHVGHGRAPEAEAPAQAVEVLVDGREPV